MKGARHMAGLSLAAALLFPGIVAGVVPRSVAPERGPDVDEVATAAFSMDPANTVLQVDSAGAVSQADPDTAPQVDSAGAVPQADSATVGIRLDDASAGLDTPLVGRMVSLLGMLVLLVIGWALSTDRRRVPWRVVLWGIGLQLIFGVFILRTAAGHALFDTMNRVVTALLGFTVEGARFLFGNLVFNNVPIGTGSPGNAPFVPSAEAVAATGAFVAFNVLPTIIFFSSLMTLLYYLGIMQWVVRGFAWVMTRTMRTSGAETLSAAGNIFVGQTEAPLLVKPFIEKMTDSELMTVMTGGFATVAGGVLAAYVGMLVLFFPDIAGHLLAASVMSAPAALVFSKLMLPETATPQTYQRVEVEVERKDANAIDAAARGAGEGLHLALNVGAMLLAFIALIALVNALLGLVGDISRITDLLRGAGWLAPEQRLTMEWLLGRVLAPLAWLMGVPWQDATTVGGLLGIKTVLNEFVAYLQLADLLGGTGNLHPRSVLIASYALCGFANFGSIAIQIGGIGGIAPSRRSDLARLGLRAMVAGTLAGFMTATVAGMLA